MRKLVATDGSKCTIAEVRGYRRIVEHRRLHNAGRKNNFVPSRVVVSLNVFDVISLLLTKNPNIIMQWQTNR